VLFRRGRGHLKPARRPALLALALAVLWAHLWLAGRALPTRLGEGAADRAGPRFEVSFVRELAPTAPPAAAPRAAPRLRRLAAAGPALAAAAAASAPTDEFVDPLAEAQRTEAAAEPVIDTSALPAVAELPTPLALVAPEAQAAQPAFEWPPSTRLSYRLTGNARGPVEGQAQVEWLRSGQRYQVFLEASVGPPFAPLMTRRESSEGDITPEGLSPRRYEMQMRVLLREPRRSVIVMDADTVRLPGGQVLPRPAGLQDAVSQFVHLTWLFTLQPELLVAGRRIELPLALPRRIEPWAYEVMGAETLYTQAGPVEAVHVRPVRAAPRGDYTAEMWVAPSLQNLPVRILVRQDAETYIDLALERLPEQAERGR
jgi:hypothetical protein